MSALVWPLDSSTTLAIVTSIASIILAVVGALTLWESRREARINFLLLRLDRLYTPLFNVIGEMTQGLFEVNVVPGLTPGSDQVFAPWDDKIAPSLAQSMHLASADLRGLYLRASRHPEEQGPDFAIRLKVCVSRDYIALLERLQRLTGEKDIKD